VTTKDSRLLIESTPNGWWYSAGLPEKRMIVVYLSDSDLIPRSRPQREHHWRQQLSEAAHTSRRLGRSADETTCRVVCANTSRLTHATGAGWIAVGDAAIALDPLSGNGIVRAFISAIAAADSIHVSPRPGTANDTYETYISATWENAIVASQETYQLEMRWVDHRFWQRRHSDQHVSQLQPLPTMLPIGVSP
jgi:flavin-dependent dehydrogenase